jgi:hypothetical protein
MFFGSTNTVVEKTAIVGFCWLAVFCYPRMLTAAEWSLESFLDLQVGYDDNPTLIPNPPASGVETQVTPYLRSQRNTEASQIEVTGLLRYTAYRGDVFAGGREDTTDAIVGLTSEFRTSERTTWKVGAEFRHDNVFQSVDLPGTLPPDTDVGAVDTPVPRNTVRIFPSWIRRLSERDTLQLDYRFRESRYSNTPETDLQDYWVNALQASFSRTIRPTYDLGIIGNVARFHNIDTGTDTDNAEILGTLDHDFSEVTHGSLEAGFRETEETTGTQTGRDSGYVLRARLRHRSELAVLDGFIFHGIRPSGLGETFQTTQFRMLWRRRIAPRLNFLLNTNIFRNVALGNATSNNDRRYAQVRAGLSWRFRPRWFVNGSYRYRYQKYDNSPDSASSNAVFFSIAYTFFENPDLF